MVCCILCCYDLVYIEETRCRVQARLKKQLGHWQEKDDRCIHLEKSAVVEYAWENYPPIHNLVGTYWQVTGAAGYAPLHIQITTSLESKCLQKYFFGGGGFQETLFSFRGKDGP